MNPGHGWLRLLRGSLLAACCVLLGVSGHAAGGGSFGSTASLLAVSGLIGFAAVIWARRERGFAQVLAAAAVSQLAFHLTLSLGPAPSAHQHPMPLDAQMLLSHLAAAVVMAAVLARGDAALWALYRWANRYVAPRPAPTSFPVASPPRLPATGRDAVVAATGLRLARATPHRGPPLPTPA